MKINIFLSCITFLLALYVFLDFQKTRHNQVKEIDVWNRTNAFKDFFDDIMREDVAFFTEMDSIMDAYVENYKNFRRRAYMHHRDARKRMMEILNN